MLGCGNWVYSLSVSLFASFTWMTKISEFKISWQIALKGCQFSVHFPVTFSLHLCIPYTVLFLLDFLCKTHDTRPLLTLLFTSPWNLSIPGFYLFSLTESLLIHLLLEMSQYYPSYVRSLGVGILRFVPTWNSRVRDNL